jgi:hypothetical protein
MSKAITATEQQSETFTVDRSDVGATIFITKYGISGTSTQKLSSYETVRYSYHIEKQRDGKTITTPERGGFQTWEDALSDAQWGINEE